LVGQERKADCVHGAFFLDQLVLAQLKSFPRF
jgi:hypothetical protein